MHKQAECWPMPTSKVSKYNNHNDNIIVTIYISNSSNLSAVHQTYYEMTATDKLPLITESVMATWIDIHPAGEKPNQHAIRSTPGGSHVWQPFTKSLLYRNWSPAHGWNVGSRPHSPSHNILKAGGVVRRSSYRATRLTGPIEIQHVVSTQLKACHWGQKNVVLNWHRWVLPHRNLKIATTHSPSFPSECSTDPLLAPPGQATLNKHDLYSS
jgi:hypothetical protein